MINEMKTKEVVAFFDNVLAKDEIIGEKEFFEFMKRANRDLTPEQRFVVLTITINAIRRG
tara:strand:- start:1219 stop:1398 length:180 start_codon:yes stop_codon:yes gene_type:complete